MSDASTTLWLDCDPGHDDAMAILLATHSPGLKLLGISTVAGNASLDRTTTNALRMLHIIDRSDIPVVAGAATPLMREAKACPEIHGESGLDGPAFPALPDTHRPVEGKAVNVMADAILSHHATTRQQVVLVATGCLTNVALLLAVHPEVKPAVREVVVMGGSIGVGNTSPCAEFNIESDPHAAQMVFSCGLRVVLMPLEVTHTMLVTPPVFARIDALGTPFSSFIHELLTFFATTYRTLFNMPDPPLHDPVTIAYLLRPELFTLKLCHVDVETGSSLTSGQTVVDLLNIRGWPEESKNVHVGTAIDVDGFWDLMLDAIASANTVSLLNATPDATVAR